MHFKFCDLNEWIFLNQLLDAFASLVHNARRDGSVVRELHSWLSGVLGSIAIHSGFFTGWKSCCACTHAGRWKAPYIYTHYANILNHSSPQEHSKHKSLKVGRAHDIINSPQKAQLWRQNHDLSLLHLVTHSFTTTGHSPSQWSPVVEWWKERGTPKLFPGQDQKQYWNKTVHTYSHISSTYQCIFFVNENHCHRY